MSVLVFIPHIQENPSKAQAELLTYSAHIAQAQNLPLVLLTGQKVSLGAYGVDKLVQLANLEQIETALLAMQTLAKQENASTIVLGWDDFGKALAPLLSAKLKAGLVAGAISLPNAEGLVQKAVFSGKAFVSIQIKTAIKIIALMPNSVGVQTVAEKNTAFAELTVQTPASRVRVLSVQKPEHAGISLQDAELVVSAGRGLKAPENWGIVEDLANALGAATACSRPVADAHWRPHHEHVGQTGVAIRPNLYIAVGISGAIQHLAGVNNSKVIVVINNDSEAPFFKAANYGVVGDAFEVLPKLTAAVKAFKNQ
jgi:electron transfer flavoprotein alpha subunit